MNIQLEHLTKTFHSPGRKSSSEVVAVNDFTFEIPDGQLIGLLGPSGCGKSTTLNLICGLEQPTSGKIFFGDRDVTALPPELRGVGMVFQNYALYPHLTVRKNILFPLENLKGKDRLTKEEMARRVDEAASLVQIGELLDRKPSELSGGQQQRVAIARALVKMPHVLLLDEPLSNLDARLRLQTREEIRKIQRSTKITTVFVTHDQEEAMSISDRIVVMKEGVLQQIGQPQQVYDDPANLFVAGFIGSPQMNFFDGELEKKDGKYQLKVGEATVVLGGKAQELLAGKGVGERKVTVGIRPEHIAFAAAPGTDTVSSKVDVSEMMGSEVYLHVNAVGRDVVLRIPTTDLPAEHRAGIPYGTEINFAFRPELIHLFDPETEKNLMY